MNDLRQGTYIGPRPDLKGKTALLQVQDMEASGRVLAQLEDMATGMGHGWWDFGKEDWDIRPATDWSAPDAEQMVLPLEMTTAEADEHTAVEEMFDPTGEDRETHDATVATQQQDTDV